MRYLVFTAICALTFTLGAAGGLLHDDARIAEGVWIERVYVGGLTQEAALQKVRSELAPRCPERVELTVDIRRWSIANTKFARVYHFDQAVQAAYQATRQGGPLARARARLRSAEKGLAVAVPSSADQARLEGLIGELAQAVDRPPRDARVTDVIGTQLYFEPEADGLTVNVVQTAAKVTATGVFPPPASVPLVVQTAAPKVRMAQLQESLNAVLASFTTSMSDGYYGVMRANRAHNVGLLVERFNGRLLLPGEEWSFNNDLGERRAEDGFKESVIFLRQPDGTIEERWSTAGGICQLATTVFNAALKANLQITQRGNHSKTVHYVQPARDATVYYGVQDLKFRNSLTHPVLLWGELRDNLDLVISIIGDRSDDYEVDLDSDFWYGRAGKGGSLWRTVKTLDGQVLKEREHICDSFYPYEKEKTSTTPD
ncbi:MAG: VanW family protein [Fimbriimonadaceae bacterium]|nr:VanW family protein [Fimbriimonadaceae bacterium]